MATMGEKQGPSLNMVKMAETLGSRGRIGVSKWDEDGRSKGQGTQSCYIKKTRMKTRQGLSTGE